MKAVQLTTAFITIAATSANEWGAPKDEVSSFLFDKTICGSARQEYAIEVGEDNSSLELHMYTKH